MAFNGLGTFQRLYNWGNDAAAGVKIRADRSDGELDGIATGLSTAICKDGQTTITANLPMATFRHTGVGDGVARTDYASLGQLQDSNIGWIAAGGTADAITASYSPAITALTDGTILSFRATAANATTTPTFAPNGLTARTIVKNGGVALSTSDIGGGLAEYFLRYNLANTRWELLNPCASVSGTFTPGISFGNASVGITYGARGGRYTRNGKCVTITDLFITLTSKGSSTGNARITGLPFTSVNVASAFGFGSCYLDLMTSLGSSAPQFYVEVNATTVKLEAFSGSVSTSITDANFQNTSLIGFGGSYEAAT